MAHDVLSDVRQLAQQLASVPTTSYVLPDTNPIPPTEILRLVGAYPRADLAAVLQALTRTALASLDRTPREALLLARIAHELAARVSDPPAQAETALTFAIASNRLGEFQTARVLAAQAEIQFSQSGDAEQEARCICEAAWADTYIGDLIQALERIARVRAATTNPLLLARADWIEGRVLSEQSQLVDAETALRKARDAFQAAGLDLEAARCERDLALVSIRRENHASESLDRLRDSFQAAGCELDAAVCKWLTGIALIEREQYAQAADSLELARYTFTNMGATFYAALCDRDLGGVFRHLDRCADSLRLSRQARDFFLAHGIRVQISACDINLGNTYYALNRYDEALALYQEAADLCQMDGRELRTAYIYANMGMAHIKQGQFSLALDCHHRALKIATDKNRPALISVCHHGLGVCHRELGQYAEALAQMERAQVIDGQCELCDGLTMSDIDLSQLYLILGEFDKATGHAKRARSVAEKRGLDSLVATCDRLVAQGSVRAADVNPILAALRNARALFLKNGQTIDAALCDLTEGELLLERTRHAGATKCFQRALKTLSPAFLDQAWRADYGLGRCALGSGDYRAALRHLGQAVQMISVTRSSFVTEQLSNDFFAHHQSVFDQAIALAAQEHADESALAFIEASKARTFLALLQHRGWRPTQDQHDAYIADLITSEKELRYGLSTLRGRLAVQMPKDVGEPFRTADELASISSAALDELNALSRTYESVVSQLRLATTGLAGASAPAPFDLAEFRGAANRALGTDWAAIDYYLTDDVLTYVVVTPDRLDVAHKHLSDLDRAVLARCTGTDPEVREMVYRGTLRGQATPVGHKSLRHLHKLLLPADLKASTLLLSPHRALHALAFHALVDPHDHSYVTERHTLIYAPSLDVLQHLLKPLQSPPISHPLVIGISEFGDQARPLPYARAEVEGLRQILGAGGQYWLEDQATRSKVMDPGRAHEMAQYDLIHLATHAVMDPHAPHNTRILLQDEPLNALDVLDLTLDTRLVTLSACQTALGKDGAGDEWMGLARAFFYAGAQAVLATLWPVNDEAMVELTGAFYRLWTGGQDAATALRQAQLEMLRAGHPAYHWAPFVLIGRP